MESTTVWSFPERGDWATHCGVYRGNWSPYIPRNIILRYSQPNEWILDQFLGSGTTLVEAKLLDRNAIGVDINEQSILLSNQNLNFQCNTKTQQNIKKGDARNLSFITNESMDLICTHPPYADIINYSQSLDGDLSLLGVEEFILQMNNVAREAYRILKKGRICAVMMGDIRSKGCVVPLGFQVMNCFLNAKFKSKEIVIKEQHNCKSTKFWEKQHCSFLLLAHEYIFIFIK